VALSEKVLSKDATFQLPVVQRSALADALNIMELQQDTSNILEHLRVVFLGESAMDEGGPQREFATLMVAQCETSYLFTFE
jgi:hypothetical protein